MTRVSSSKLKAGFVAIILAGSFACGVPARAEKVLNGAVCQERVTRLTGEISWLSDLEAAKEKARESKKLIFWVNMLGKLEGDT